MKLETAKGVRDFPAQEKIIRNSMLKAIAKCFERFGFNPLETPLIERYEVLSAKFAAGETSDAIKEIFTFEDQGKRKLGLRFDLTLPLSRYVAMNPTMKMPFKRYELGRVYRDGPIKLGRYREFWQCDADIVGVKGMKAEVELILLALDVFEKLKLDAYIEVNNRKLLNGILDSLGITSNHDQVIMILDKLNKIGLAGVEKELFEMGILRDKTKELTDIFDIRGTTNQILKKLESRLQNEEGIEGVKELRLIFASLEKHSDRVKLNISLARGLSYYTGTVFEGFLKSNKIRSSICGGGRYDNMIGLFANNKDFPAVGISFGIEPITEFVKISKKGLKKTVTKVFVIPINTYEESSEIVQRLRKEGINSEIDLMDRGLSKNLSYANSFDIPFVVIVGEEELKQEKVKLRDTRTGKEELLTLEEAIKKLKKT